MARHFLDHLRRDEVRLVGEGGKAGEESGSSTGSSAALNYSRGSSGRGAAEEQKGRDRDLEQQERLSRRLGAQATPGAAIVFVGGPEPLKHF